MDVDAWLRELGLDRYAATFRDNEVDGDVLPRLTAEDLTDLGVTAVGHRRKLLDAVAGFRAGEQTVTAAPPPPPGPASRAADVQRRHLTVMFCDLVGSAALSTALDPEDLRDVIGGYHRRVADVVGRFDGYVAKYMGDGVLVYFGYPVAHEDDAERAVLAALELVGPQQVPLDLPVVGEMLRVRVGIATGLVVVGDLLGEGAAREEAVVGETPNLAARLQQLAEPGGVVVSQTTRHLLAGLFELEDLGSHLLKGFEQPVPAWRVLRRSAAEGRFEALHGAAVLPLLGREHELGLLLDRWEQAKEGEGQVVLLSGEAGIGKSRLLRAVRERLADEKLTPLSHYCSPYHTSTALHPVLAMLERAAGLRAADPPGTRAEKLRTVLARGTPEPDEALALLGPLLGVDTGARARTADLPAQRQKQRTLEVLADQVAGLAEATPVLSVYEDVHWADPSTLELLGMVLERVRDLPVLLVLTYRPEFAPPWTGHTHATSLTLSRLTQRRGSLLIDRLTGGRRLPPDVVEQILDKTDGVPLFIEELTKAVLESGLVEESADGFTLTGPLPPLAIPATLHDSLMARLDRLAPVKEVAQIGAVIGRDFSHELLAAVAGRSERELVDALDQLVAAELVFRRGVPPQARYSFKHALVQDAAYESILRARRRQLHARIAQQLSAGQGEADAPLELVAEHHTRAASYAEAARAWLAAAERARARHATREATSHLTSCLSAVRQCQGDPGVEDGAVQDVEVSALALLGDLAGAAGDLAAANEHYDAALAACTDQRRRRWIANTYHHAHHTERDGARIAYYSHGTGSQTLLLVNPLVYGLALFQPILERLCQDFRILTVDCRGTGESEPLTRPFRLREHAADVAAVIEASGARPVVGVGLSRGSNLLVRLGAERPDLVSALVTVGCPLVAGGFGSLATYSGYWTECPQAHARQDVPGLLRILAAWMYTEPGTEELKRMLVERGLRLPPETVLSFYDDDPDVDVSHLLHGIAVPTLVTHGTADQLIPFAGAEYLAREIPGAQLYGFDGKGHLPIFTAPDEFCDVVRRFATTVSMAPTTERHGPGSGSVPLSSV